MNNVERTLVIIKPDATKKKLEDKIISLYAMNGLNIVEHKRVTAPKEILEKHYGIHKEKPFYPSLVEFMQSGDVVILVLEGDGIIEKVRNIHGNTNPELAEEGTIRKLYGTDKQQNAVHASDSIESAEFEIEIWSPLLRNVS